MSIRFSTSDQDDMIEFLRDLIRIPSLPTNEAEVAERIQTLEPEIAAIMATLIAHQQTQRAAHVIQRGKRDTSNWKWLGRWERLQR